MAFGNSILAGEELIRTGMRSPNYVPGVSGWRFGRDGFLEAANGLFRGTLTAGTTTKVVITSSGGIGLIRFLTGDPAEDGSGVIFVQVVGAGSSRFGDLTLQSPSLALFGATSGLNLRGQSPDGTVGAVASLSAGPVTTPPQSGHDVILNAHDDVGILAGDDLIVQVGDAVQLAGTRTLINTTDLFRQGVKQPIRNNGAFLGNTDGAGDVQIAHGLPTTPFTVLASPATQNQGVAITNIGATTFTARLFTCSTGAALASAFVGFHWQAACNT